MYISICVESLYSYLYRETYTPPKGYLEVKNIENIDPTMNEESNEDEIWLFRLPFGMDASMLDGVELPVNNEIPSTFIFLDYMNIEF